MSIIIPGRDLFALRDLLFEREHYICVAVAEDGSQLFAVRRTLTGCDIVAGCDEFGCSEIWSYEFFTTAILAFVEWSGNAGTEPEGWIRHMPSGRRRPAGDPTKEHVAP